MTGVEHSQVPHAQEQAPAPEGIRGSGTGRPAMTFDEVIGLAQVDVPHREPYRTAAVVVVGLALAPGRDGARNIQPVAFLSMPQPVQ